MQNYKDLKVWEKAHFYTLRAYETSISFPTVELYRFTNQLRRSAASVPANIAEGCGKNSNQELAHFLNIVLGPANESEYFLLLAKDLAYMTNEKYKDVTILINEIKAMVIALINKVRA
jgi:four helix bundle protein